MNDDKGDFADWFLVNHASSIARALNQNIHTAPPFKLSLFTDSTSSWLVFSIHHSLFDGISLPLLLQDVESQFFNHPLRPLVSGGELLDVAGLVSPQEITTFWQDHFRGYDWPTFPFRQALTSGGNVKQFRLGTPLSTLKAGASQQQITLQALFTATYAQLLANLVYETDDVVFGVSHGPESLVRPHRAPQVIRTGRLLPVKHIESAMYPTLSVLPLRVDLREPGSLLQSTQQRISSCIKFEQTPLGRIQQAIRPGQPLFETLFSVSVQIESQSNIWTAVKSHAPAIDVSLQSNQ